MSNENHLFYLKRCIEISKNSRESGNMPFGALLVNKEGEIILEQMNIEGTDYKCTGHAETQLMEKASMMFSKDYLWGCTLYSTAEPCAMCTGAIYWGNVGRIVYGMSEVDLLKFTGSDEKNPTFDLPCRDIIKKGQKKIEVLGPFDTLYEDIAEVHKNFWNN